MKPVPTSRLLTYASYTVAAIVALVPVHALLTVWLASAVGHYELVRLWKEFLLLALAPVAIWQAWRQPDLWRQLRRGWLVWAMLCYVLLHVLLGLVALHKGQVNRYALLYALIVNLRPIVFFLEAYAVAWSAPWLRIRWRQLLLWPAALVVVFGLLQLTVLPAGFLRHFGYGPATIAPFETVDNKPDYVRLQSTLRGSNPLGAYLVIVVSALLVLVRRPFRRNSYWLYAGLVAVAAVLAGSFSRSAYVGACLAFLASVVMSVSDRRERRYLAYGLAVLVLLATALFATFRTNDTVENTLFHTNERSVSAASSNAVRASAMRAGLDDVIGQPFGRGPGTAGPASVHNSQPARIAEDYYLQIGQETGWLGLGLFIAILVMVGKRLWHRRSQPLDRLLLASLVGICFINLVQHAWTDDTLALVWWGMVGIALSATASAKQINKATTP